MAKISRKVYLRNSGRNLILFQLGGSRIVLSRVRSELRSDPRICVKLRGVGVFLLLAEQPCFALLIAANGTPARPYAMPGRLGVMIHSAPEVRAKMVVHRLVQPSLCVSLLNAHLKEVAFCFVKLEIFRDTAAQAVRRTIRSHSPAYRMQQCGCTLLFYPFCEVTFC